MFSPISLSPYILAIACYRVPLFSQIASYAPSLRAIPCISANTTQTQRCGTQRPFLPRYSCSCDGMVFWLRRQWRIFQISPHAQCMAPLLLMYLPSLPNTDVPNRALFCSAEGCNPPGIVVGLSRTYTVLISWRLILSVPQSLQFCTAPNNNPQ